MMVVWVGRGLTHHESSSTAAAALAWLVDGEPSSTVDKSKILLFRFSLLKSGISYKMTSTGVAPWQCGTVAVWGLWARPARWTGSKK